MSNNKKIAMGADLVLQTIVDELRQQYGCHTIIVYGSHARGDFTPVNDYGVAGIASDDISICIVTSNMEQFTELLQH